MNKKDLLIIFTKNPEPGKVKTRLAKDIGDRNALEIYKTLLKHSQKQTASLNISKHVYYSNEIPEEDLWDRGGFDKKLQRGSDLGLRMENAFRDGFVAGFEKVLIIGTDLFDLKTAHIEDAFKALDQNDYVIGPARDGGYYLLGMKSLNSALFRNKNWSTSTVLEDSLNDLMGEKVELLEIQNDIDVLDDIKTYPAFQKFI
ncbi:TIGR04282 family arsenosugar biosynthesis glycosyltransferase [Pontixanthobacter gangjinensis]|uniref:TIGR04282 family arsenosugar biosynthesis glycosyltransferase n=1 Tax=Christiangramia aestuarii TaxID=1028746 RepID=UPI00311AFD25